MKKNLLLVSLLSGLALAHLPAAAGEEVRRMLATNRELLKRYQVEVAELKEKEEREGFSDALKRQADNAAYKLKAVREDSARLEASLPAPEQAHEFLKDLLIRKSLTQVSRETAARRQGAGPPVKIPEAHLAEIIRSTNQMHEEALKYVGERRLKEAVKIYEEIILANPDDDQAYLLMGHCRLLSGQYSKAEECFYSAVNIDPKNLDEIAPFYENITLENPDDDSAFTHLGYAYLMLGEYLKAKGAFRSALNINPQNPQASSGLEVLKG